MARDRPSHGDGSANDRSDFSRRTFMRATGASVGGLALGGFAGSAGAAANGTPRLHTEGRWLVDPDGNQVKLRGLATAGLAFIEQYHPKSVTEIVDWATDTSRGWHPKVVRLPCGWGGIQEYGGVDAFVTDILRPAVDQLAERDIYALVDFHLVRPYTQAATDDYNADQDPEDELDPIDDVMTAFWDRVAPEFADDDHVLYELFNEPTYPVTWSDYGEDVSSQEDEWLLWRDTAQPWVDLVQSHAPDTPLMIGSPHWTSRTSFATQYPFEGENLVYAAHIYPDNGQPSDFDSQYGAPAEEVPVVVTEFGWDPDGDGEEYDGTTSGWGESYRDWVEGYDNMGWISWCFDDSWAPTFFDSPDAGANEPWTLKDDYDQSGWYIKQWLDDRQDDMIVGSSGGGSGGDDGGSDDGSSGGDLSPGTYQVVNVNSGKALDVEGWSTADGGNVLQWSPSGSENQQWDVIDNGDGTYRLEAVHSGKALEVADGSTAGGANVQQWTWNEYDNQRFHVTEESSGEYRLEPVHSGMAVGVEWSGTSDGDNVVQQSWDGSASQLWTFESI